MVVTVVVGADIRAVAVDTRNRHDGHIEAGICGRMAVDARTGWKNP